MNHERPTDDFETLARQIFDTAIRIAKKCAEPRVGGMGGEEEQHLKEYCLDIPEDILEQFPELANITFVPSYEISPGESWTEDAVFVEMTDSLMSTVYLIGSHFSDQEPSVTIVTRQAVDMAEEVISVDGGYGDSKRAKSHREIEALRTGDLSDPLLDIGAVHELDFLNPQDHSATPAEELRLQDIAEALNQAYPKQP